LGREQEWLMLVILHPVHVVDPRRKQENAFWTPVS
jgi:hypothetical protein